MRRLDLGYSMNKKWAGLGWADSPLTSYAHLIV